MKILTSGDWHLKLGQKGVPKDWAINRYQLMFSQLHDLEKQVALHVIAGDIFDKLPNMEELALYFEFIKGCTIRTLVFAGNHESILKDTTFFSHLKEVTNSINNLVTIIDDYYTEDEFDLIPYNKLKEFASNPSLFPHPKPLLFTHVRGDIPPHVKSEVDLDIFSKWQNVLAGDLHSYENSQRNILYSGSPVTTSFHRNLTDTGVIIFNTSDASHKWVKLEVPQLIRKTITVGEPMPATTYHHTIYEVEGDLAELGAMVDSTLIDKKVLKRESDTALILDPKMSMEEELREYLSYILQLGDAEIDSAINTFKTHSHLIHD